MELPRKRRGSILADVLQRKRLVATHPSERPTASSIDGDSNHDNDNVLGSTSVTNNVLLTPSMIRLSEHGLLTSGRSDIEGYSDVDGQSTDACLPNIPNTISVITCKGIDKITKGDLSLDELHSNGLPLSERSHSNALSDTASNEDSKRESTTLSADSPRATAISPKTSSPRTTSPRTSSSRISEEAKTDVISNHYNKRLDRSIKERHYSPLINLRLYNNWIKACLLSMEVARFHTTLSFLKSCNEESTKSNNVVSRDEEYDEEHDDERHEGHTVDEVASDCRRGRLSKYHTTATTAEDYYDDATEQDLKKPGVNLKLLDLCCGKGGDVGKYLEHPSIKKIYAIDIAAHSIRDAIKRFHIKSVRDLRYHHNREYHRRFSDSKIEGNEDNVCHHQVEFIVADCHRRLDLLSKIQSQINIVACQFALHYAFESESRLSMLLRNASDALTRGGSFIATVPNAHAIVQRMINYPKQEDDDLVFVARDKGTLHICDSDLLNFDNFDDFGACYRFTLKDAIDDCPEYLVKPQVLIKHAERVGLKLIQHTGFHEFRSLCENNIRLKNLTRSMLRKAKKMTRDESDVFGLYDVYVFHRV